MSKNELFLNVESKTLTSTINFFRILSFTNRVLTIILRINSKDRENNL